MEKPACNCKEMKGTLQTGALFLALYLFVYGSISLRSGLLWDEMADIEGSATGSYVAAGRWALALYRLIFGVGIFPVVAAVVAGVYISVSLVLQTRMLGLDTWGRRLFYGGMYLACIQWAFQLEFSHQSDALALGLLGSTVAVWWMQWRRWCLAVVALTFSFGVYQTVSLHTLCLLLALALSAGDDGKWTPSAWLKPLACLAGAMALSLLLTQVSYLLPWVSEEEIAWQRGYQTSMSRWSEFPADASLGAQLDFLWYYGSRFFKMTCKNMLGAAYAGQWVYSTALLPLAFLVYKCLRGGITRRDAVACAGYIFLWFLPFCPILLLFSDQGARVNLAEPIALALLWGLAMLRADKTCTCRWLPFAMCVLVVVALVKSAYRVGDIALNEARIFEQEAACVQALYSRGMSAADAVGLQDPDIILLGHIPAHPEVTWPRQECLPGRGMVPPEQLSYYVRYLNLGNIRKGTDLDMQLHGAAYSTMPSWPAGGSVRVDGGTVIIRVD